jgi:hydrogenase expression/formation protein HypE
MGGNGSRGGRSEEEVLDAIEERRRRPRRKLLDEQITLSHGAGGKSSHDLVEALFLRELRNPMLEPLTDSALIGDGVGKLAFTTDSFVVRPLFFPGGDIGELAVNGTVNDLAMAGARPIALSAGFIVEEGLPVADLDRIVASMARAAEAAGVEVATGDTKVVERGKADGLYINTSGVGTIEHELVLGPGAIRAGDRVIVSGPIGDHGMAIMIARGELALEVELESDTAPLNGLVAALLAATDGVRSLRDPTRGGLATVLAELALSAQLGITIDEASLPVRPEVNGACEILGIDPLYVANEGKLVAIVAPEAEETSLAALRSHPLGADAVTVAEVRPDPPGLVLLETSSAARGSSTCWPGIPCRGSAERWPTHRSSAPGAGRRSATSSTSTSRATRRSPSRLEPKARIRRHSRSASRRCSPASPTPASVPAASESTTSSPTRRRSDLHVRGTRRDAGSDRARPRAARLACA